MRTIIDGGYLTCRAKTTPGRGQLSSKGRKTGMVYGVLCDMRKLLKQGYNTLEMTYDIGTPYHRYDKHEDYKKGREGGVEITDAEYKLLETALRFLGIPQFYHPDLEADDVIATRVKNVEDEVHIYTVDKDLYQLVDYRIKIHHPDKGIIETNDVKDEFGVTADKIVKLLAMTGDKSDNIDGITGIGPKTASKYLNNKELTDRQEELIKNNKDVIQRNKELITLKTDCQLKNKNNSELSEYELKYLKECGSVDFYLDNGYDYNAFRGLMKEYDMESVCNIPELLRQGNLFEFV